jgi:hypothetical protein
MATMGGLDMALCNIPAAFGSILMDGDEYVRCRHCGYGGCDLRMQCENGCTCHTVRFLRTLAHLDAPSRCRSKWALPPRLVSIRHEEECL